MLDLWTEFHRVLKDNGGSLNVLWTKGHPTRAQAENMFLSDVEVYLNKAADRFADWAAEEAQLSENHVHATLRADETAVHVLKRILTAQREVLFNSDRERVGLREPRRTRGAATSLSERLCRLRDVGHDPKALKASIKCSVCGLGFSTKGKLDFVWPFFL